jgi:hypothetical protein
MSNSDEAAALEGAAPPARTDASPKTGRILAALCRSPMVVADLDVTRPLVEGWVVVFDGLRGHVAANPDASKDENLPIALDLGSNPAAP